MPPTAVAVPTLLKEAGYLFIAPLATAVPTNTVAGSVFTDAWAAAWLPLGAVEDGTDFAYSIDVEPMSVADFVDPISYATTGRAGTIAFNLANWSLSNYRRAMNGGVAAMTATSGTGATSLFTLNPPTPGAEVRCMIGWESLSNDVRLICHQTIQGGEVASAFKKPPTYAVIPCTFNLEVPTAGQPWTMYAAGVARGGV
jgi:hypothetical protein